MPPPTASGTRIRTGRVGKVCAWDASASNANTSASAFMQVRAFIVPPPRGEALKMKHDPAIQVFQWAVRFRTVLIQPGSATKQATQLVDRVDRILHGLGGASLA